MPEYWNAKALSVLIVATVLAWIGAQIVARRYRAQMLGLMRAPDPTPPSRGGPRRTSSAAPAPGGVAALDAQAKTRRLLGLLIGLSLLIALTQSVISLSLMLDQAPTWPRVLTLAVVYIWPVVPVLSVLHRWHWVRLLLGMLIWCALSATLVMMRSSESQSLLGVLAWLLMEPSVGLAIVVVLTHGGRTRAVAPWIWLPLALLCTGSILALDRLQFDLEREADWVFGLVSVVNAQTGIALVALAPWLLAIPLMKQYGRLLARAYTAKWLSDLMSLFTAIWAIALTRSALTAAAEDDLAALALLLPLLWIPITMGLSRALLRSTARPPTLLVLRVFQRDTAVQALFDGVIERWRRIGNTVLIAGTDLVDRTIDAADVFAFIDGQLASRFIRNAGDLERHVAEFDLAPDADGRYRINECYCADDTWQLALARLVQLSDVVLMDLRGFTAENAGCQHELRVLAQAPGLHKVVVLADARTDRALAEQLTRPAPGERFHWLDESTAAPLPAPDIFRALLPAPLTRTGAPA